jgi:hypothetical protein
MLSGDATNTNLTVFGFTRSELDPTIFRTRGQHANYYATDEVTLDIGNDCYGSTYNPSRCGE